MTFNSKKFQYMSPDQTNITQKTDLRHLISCWIYHSKADKFYQKSSKNVFKNYVISEGGGMSNDYDAL